MSTQSTQREWTYRADRTIADAGGVPLMRCYADRNEVANGHLAAAAPRLLEACKELLRVTVESETGNHDEWEVREAINEARAAIDAARPR